MVSSLLREGVPMRMLVAAAVTFVILTAPAAPIRAQDELRAQVEAANSAWTSAFNAKDVDGITALYTDDALLLSAGHEATRGKAKIAEYWRGAFERLPGAQIAFETIDARREGGIVYIVGRFEGSVPKADGGTQTFSGNNLRVLEPAGAGGWTTRVHIYNLHE